MKDYKYKFVVTGNKVIAISSYAGKTVKGIAKCHPNDEFNEEIGKNLAAARCNRKIAEKRYKRAKMQYDNIEMLQQAVEREKVIVTNYYNDAYVRLQGAIASENVARAEIYK